MSLPLTPYGYIGIPVDSTILPVVDQTPNIRFSSLNCPAPDAWCSAPYQLSFSLIMIDLQNLQVVIPSDRSLCTECSLHNVANYQVPYSQISPVAHILYPEPNEVLSFTSIHQAAYFSCPQMTGHILCQGKGSVYTNRIIRFLFIGNHKM